MEQFFSQTFYAFQYKDLEQFLDLGNFNGSEERRNDLEVHMQQLRGIANNGLTLAEVIVPRLLTGERASQVMTEPGAGSDLAAKIAFATKASNGRL